MDQKRTIQRKDIDGLELGLSQVYGKPHERFFQHLVDYFTGWLTSNASLIAKDKVPPERALLVVYSESPDLEFERIVGEGVEPIAVYATTHTLSDGVAVAVENLSKIFHALPQFKGGANEAYKFIEKHLSEDQVFAVLMLGQDRLLVHEAGVPLDEWIQSPRVIPMTRMSETLITPDLIDKQLNDFHADSMASYRGTTARLMWQIGVEPKLSKFGPKPELHVQSALLTYFRGIYSKTVAFADEEVALSEGRVDIRIARADKLKGRAITMVELKVLDPTNSDNENLKWAHKGILQAHGYKKTPHTDAAFACVYDARRDKIDKMPSLFLDAGEKDVRLKVHEMDVPDPRPPKKFSTGKGTKSAPAKPATGRASKASTAAKKAPQAAAVGKGPPGLNAAPKKP